MVAIEMIRLNNFDRMKILSVVGARPNFMKIAQFIKAISLHNDRIGAIGAKKENKSSDPNFVVHILVHTGQHYDERMSKAFFETLEIPEADINLGVGSGSHAEQVGETMIKLEKIFLKEKPDWVIVVGDVNATLASTITAKKLWINVCHIEAGLRSGDMKMPEEINRLVTDRLADLLLTPDLLSGENLKMEGIPENKIKFVGNIMIDTLEANRQKASLLNIPNIIRENMLDSDYTIGNREKGIEHINSTTSSYALITMHRPSNVDHKEILNPIIDFLCDEVAKDMSLIWPIHPRSQKQLKEFDIWEKIINTNNIILLHPIGYHEMLRLNIDANIMLTDSGGLQEECTILGTPCLTLRWNTERPITLRKNGGASVLVGNNIEQIRREYNDILTTTRKPERPELWDGKTAGRCLSAILKYNYE